MALHPTGLGKGLDALIRQTQEKSDPTGGQTLRITDIIPNPRQPRREFNDKGLEELAASIKSQGLLQPLLVRPLGPPTPDKYEIVAGERRWRASRMAGLKEVPVLIRAFSAQDTLTAALIENLQREDLNPLDEALGLQALKEEFRLSQDDIAHALGKSRSAIANSLRLLSLPESMRPLLADGRLSPGHARALLSITESDAQEYLKDLILDHKLSVREAEGLAAEWKEKGSFALVGLAGEARGDNDRANGEQARKKGPLPPRQQKPQSAKILEIQNRMASLLEIPVRVTGKENKGKITLSFSSKEELHALLARLSDAVLEGASHKEIQGANHAALAGSTLAKLESPAKQKLTPHGNPELDGARHPNLEGAVLQALTGEDQKVLERAPRAAKTDCPAAAQPGGASEQNADENDPTVTKKGTDSRR